MAENKCLYCYLEKYCDHLVQGYPFNSKIIPCSVFRAGEKSEKTTFALECPTHGILAMNIPFKNMPRIFDIHRGKCNEPLGFLSQYAYDQRIAQR